MKTVLDQENVKYRLLLISRSLRRYMKCDSFSGYVTFSVVSFWDMRSCQGHLFNLQEKIMNSHGTFGSFKIHTPVMRCNLLTIRRNL